mmetsp:Transcript_9118/g.23436  ORF Transcript_9118/g.23436 Transcript_9118/m.23436 type:complete len:203 (+) Transcript_9118:316-924(+)
MDFVQHKVGVRRHRAEPRNLVSETLEHTVLLGAQGVDRRHDLVAVLERGKPRSLGRCVDVVRLFDGHHGADDVGVPDAVSQPEPGQPGPLGERSAHHHVLVRRQKWQRGGVAEVCVRLINHQEARFLENDFGVSIREHCSGRVIRRRQEADCGTRGPDGGHHRVDVHCEVGPPGHLDNLNPGGLSEEGVHPESRSADDNGLG